MNYYLRKAYIKLIILIDMITNIEILLKEYDFMNSKNNFNNLTKLSKVNIFVGANNSGKSRFLRSLCENKISYQLEKINKIHLELNKLEKKLIELLGDNISHFYEDNILNIMFLHKSLKNSKKINKFLKFYEDIKKNIKISIKNPRSSPGKSNLEIANFLRKYFEDNDFELLFTLTENPKYKSIYVPILRGLRNIINTEKFPNQTETELIGNDFKSPFKNIDCYRDRTIFDYFNPNRSINTYLSDFKNTFEIFTGLKLYEDIKKNLLGKFEERNFISRFEEFLTINFFNNKRITLIPKYDSDVLSIKIGNEEERPIFDLGDGLQTIIILTYPLFKYENENLFLFIEEPELGLHPGMQRKILQTYCEKFPKTQFFLTTHSNHLLDLTLDFDEKVSIYSFNKNEKQKFEIENISPNKEILEILGVRNSSVFLSNCIIWVEGISDRIYLKKYLELYQKIPEEKLIFEEDKHFTILEYGGGNITHFNFDEKEKNKKSKDEYKIYINPNFRS